MSLKCESIGARSIKSQKQNEPKEKSTPKRSNINIK